MSAARKIPARGPFGLRDSLHRLRLMHEARRARRAWEERFATDLPDDVEALLQSMYRSEPQPGSDGVTHAIDSGTRISREQGLLLHHLCRERKPDVVLEVGLAYGFSTVFLLAALRQQGRGRLIALDPFQSRLWHGIGAMRGAQLGVDDRLDVIEERAEHVLPRLAAERRRVQLAYIDGDHRFDSVMLDFTLVARLCDVGAAIVFDDLWMPSIRCVLRYIEANRKDWRRIPSPLRNACILERIGKDERTWDHFVGF